MENPYLACGRPARVGRLTPALFLRFMLLLALLPWAARAQTRVSAGGNHSLSIHPDGTLWAWGNNASGQLGNGAIGGINPTPTQVGTATNWASVSAGSVHTLAVRTDGTLWAWGSNSNGQLGTGGGSSATPVQVGAATNWASVSAGSVHSLAVRTDGTLWAWGNNASGQLGTGGGNGNNPTPTQVGAATSWASVSAGANHSLAVRTDGTLWAWGNNASGQLGNNAIGGSSATPVQVGADTNWASVSAGSNHSLAVGTDGALWAWGSNSNGQLGNGTVGASYSIRRQVGTATNWASVSAGNAHTLAVRTDGTLWAWGTNASGQLGTGG
ncbi:RCC1 domain-containing protein, partial [Hymenobacter convexus]|uniref:RCC1 domain-containing protein n=1 Tax=Hymenobacter sp. CA1UV-4 TaxID=3063782 RepID=UPI002713C713|nr:hypothetical protein [Hymenobacter sp. CA1UV-4]